MSEKNDTTQAKTSVAKVFLYFAGFSIIMRCNIWVSIVVLTVTGVYLLKAGSLQKALGYARPFVEGLMAKGIGLVKQWYKEDALQKKTSSKKPINVRVRKNRFDVKSGWDAWDDIPEPPASGFNENRFDEIWRNCPDRH